MQGSKSINFLIISWFEVKKKLFEPLMEGFKLVLEEKYTFDILDVIFRSFSGEFGLSRIKSK